MSIRNDMSSRLSCFRFTKLIFYGMEFDKVSRNTFFLVCLSHEKKFFDVSLLAGGLQGKQEALFYRYVINLLRPFLPDLSSVNKHFKHFKIGRISSISSILSILR